MLCIGLYRGAVVPNSSLYPDVALSGKFRADMIKAMDGLSNAIMIEKFAEVMENRMMREDRGLSFRRQQRFPHCVEMLLTIEKMGVRVLFSM